MNNNSKENLVSISVIRRLPRYYRFLSEIIKSGKQRISSAELSEKMGLTASQIRQDFNCFGGFGQQGYGYNTEVLHREIGIILGLQKRLKVIIIGAGNLGSVIANNMDFENKGFELAGIFDTNPEIVGKEFRGLRVMHSDKLEEFCRLNNPSVAVLCIPKEAAAEIADQLVKLGINGFWNFSHFDLGGRYPNIPVENVHLGDSLMILRCLMKKME